MADEDHVASMVSDDVIWMGCSVVQELLDFCHGVFCGVGLLGGDGAKSRKHGGVDGAGIVKESAGDFLDKLLVSGAEDRTSVNFFAVLCFSAVDWFDVGVGLVLWASRMLMTETLEGI